MECQKGFAAVIQFSCKGHEYLKIWQRRKTRLFPTLPSCLQNHWMRFFIGRHNRFFVRIHEA